MIDTIAMQSFESDLPLTVFIRPMGQPGAEWSEYEKGPGHFDIPSSNEIYLRVKNIDDDDLYSLVKVLNGVANLTTLNLSENRKVTDVGVSRLSGLPELIRLNLSSCGITNQGLAHLEALKRLKQLDISFCNRITDEGLRKLKSLTQLEFLDIQGCVKTTHAGVKRIERRGLTIHR